MNYIQRERKIISKIGKITYYENSTKTCKSIIFSPWVKEGVYKLNLYIFIENTYTNVCKNLNLIVIWKNKTYTVPSPNWIL